MGKSARLIIGLVLCTQAAGCSFIRHVNQAILFKRFADNQRQIEECIDKRDRLFLSLKNDIENNRLRAGVPEELMVKEYGQPVVCWDTKGRAGQTCFYRRATHYFNTDAVYLKFDMHRKLQSWRLVPASSNP